MRTLLFSPSAQNDLDAIFDYTLERWSYEQAAEYTKAIYEACTELTETPEKAHDVSEIRKGYRRWHIGAHSIYFTYTDVSLIVVRILSQKMQAMKWLS